MFGLTITGPLAFRMIELTVPFGSSTDDTFARKIDFYRSLDSVTVNDLVVGALPMRTCIDDEVGSFAVRKCRHGYRVPAGPCSY